MMFVSLSELSLKLIQINAGNQPINGHVFIAYCSSYVSIFLSNIHNIYNSAALQSMYVSNQHNVLICLFLYLFNYLSLSLSVGLYPPVLGHQNIDAELVNTAPRDIEPLQTLYLLFAIIVLYTANILD